MSRHKLAPSRPIGRSSRLGDQYANGIGLAPARRVVRHDRSPVTAAVGGLRAAVARPK